MVELVVVSTILVIASVMYLRAMVSTSGLRKVSRDNTVAAEATRIVLEAMINEDFEEIFERFNPDARDDDKGRYPGHRFAVESLEPLPGTPDGLVGEIVFPTLVDPESKPKAPKAKKTDPGEGLPETVSFPGASSPFEWQLREDFVDERLGMPRDLNGDNIIDDKDHSEDYILLPVCVTIDWQGANGPQRCRVYTMLADYTKLDEELLKAREKAAKEREKEEKKKKKKDGD
jgi:hypothetical protein